MQVSQKNAENISCLKFQEKKMLYSGIQSCRKKFIFFFKKKHGFLITLNRFKLFWLFFFYIVLGKCTRNQMKTIKVVILLAKEIFYLFCFQCMCAIEQKYYLLRSCNAVHQLLDTSNFLFSMISNIRQRSMTTYFSNFKFKTKHPVTK